MNILLPIKWPVGGIRTYLKYVLKHDLLSSNHYTIIAPWMVETEHLLDSLSSLNIRYRKCTASPASFLSALTQEPIQNHYHLIHSHGFTAGLFSIPGSVLTRTPHLLTSHDVLDPKHFDGLKGKFTRQALALLFHQVSSFNAISQDAKANLKHFYPAIPDDKIDVILNGINTRQFADTEVRPIRNELNLDNQRFIIGFLGRFMAQKGFRYLIEAIEQIKVHHPDVNPPLVVAVGAGGYLEQDSQWIAEKGLSDSFRFLPFTENIAPTLRAMDVVAMPSLWECCPLLPMECLLTGTPVIGSDCIGMREILNNSPATIIPSKNSSALSKAILTHMKQDQRPAYQDYIPVAQQRFDVNNTSTALASLYKKYARQ